MVNLQVHALHIIVEIALRHTALVLVQQLVVTDKVLNHVQQIDVETVLASVDIEKDVVDIVIHSLLTHAQQTDVKIVHVTLDIEQAVVEIVIHSIMIRALKMDAVIVVVRQVLVMAVLEIVTLRKIKLVVQMVVDNAHLINIYVMVIGMIMMYFSVWQIVILRGILLVVLTIVVTVHLDMEQLHVVLMDVMDRFKSHVLRMDAVIVRQHIIQNLALL